MCFWLLPMRSPHRSRRSLPTAQNCVPALASLKEGFSALNIAGALAYARQAQDWSGGRPGEIVYIGPARVDLETTAAALPANLRRSRSRPMSRTAGSVASRCAGAKRIQLMAGNSHGQKRGTAARNLQLHTQYAGTKFAPRKLRLETRR